MERRFIISEAEVAATALLPTITETELKWRIKLIITQDWYGQTDKPLDILLHGEAGQGVKYCETCHTYHSDGAGCPGEELPAGLFHGPGLPSREQPDEICELCHRTGGHESWCSRNTPCACVYENGKLVAPCAYHQDK